MILFDVKILNSDINFKISINPCKFHKKNILTLLTQLVIKIKNL